MGRGRQCLLLLLLCLVCTTDTRPLSHAHRQHKQNMKHKVRKQPEARWSTVVKQKDHAHHMTVPKATHNPVSFDNRLMNLEKEVLSLLDIPMPVLMRLIDLSETATTQGRDLEAGGGATKNTQYEKDMYQMIYLTMLAGHLEDAHVPPSSEYEYAMTNPKPRPVDFQLPDSDKSYTVKKRAYLEAFKPHQEKGLCVNCVDNLAEFDSRLGMILNHMPLTMAIGEGMDQYFDLVKKCLTDFGYDTSDQFIAASGEGPDIKDMIEAIAARFSNVHSDDNPLVVEQVSTMVKKLDYDIVASEAAEAPESGGHISACEYVRSYLAERNFYAEKDAPKIAQVFTGISRGDGEVSFEDFLPFAASLGHDVDSPKILAQMSMLYKMADLSAYFSVNGPPTTPGALMSTGSLNPCEFQLAYTMMKLNHGWSPDVFWSEAKGTPLFLKNPYTRFESFVSQLPNAQPQMTYEDLERVFKTADLGNYASVYSKSEPRYSLDKLVVDAEPQVDDGSEDLAKVLFASIGRSAGGSNVKYSEVANEASPPISGDALLKFLDGLVCDSAKAAPGPPGVEDDSPRQTLPSMSRRLRKQVEEAIRDYSRDGGHQITFAEFKTAMSHYPVLVHGVTAADIITADSLASGRALEEEGQTRLYQSIGQREFVGMMVMLTKFGGLLEDDKGGDLGTRAKMLGFTIPPGGPQTFRFANFVDQVLGGDGMPAQDVARTKYFSAATAIPLTASSADAMPSVTSAMVEVVDEDTATRDARIAAELDTAAAARQQAQREGLGGDLMRETTGSLSAVAALDVDEESTASREAREAREASALAQAQREGLGGDLMRETTGGDLEKQLKPRFKPRSNMLARSGHGTSSPSSKKHAL